MDFHIGYILMAAAGIFILHGVVVYIYERIHPFEHRRIPLDELPTHVRQLRRGFRGTKMVLAVAVEEEERRIVLRKCCPWGTWDFYVKIIVDEGDATPAMKARLLQDVEEKSRSAYQIAESRKQGGGFAIICRPAEGLDLWNLVAGLVRSLLINHYKVSPSAQFRIRVLGQISPYDREFSYANRMPPSAAYPRGIPYKWWQAETEPTLARRMGRVIGMVLCVLLWPFRREK